MEEKEKDGVQGLLLDGRHRVGHVLDHLSFKEKRHGRHEACRVTLFSWLIWASCRLLAGPCSCIPRFDFTFKAARRT